MLCSLCYIFVTVQKLIANIVNPHITSFPLPKLPVYSIAFQFQKAIVRKIFDTCVVLLSYIVPSVTYLICGHTDHARVI